MAAIILVPLTCALVTITGHYTLKGLTHIANFFLIKLPTSPIDIKLKYLAENHLTLNQVKDEFNFLEKNFENYIIRWAQSVPDSDINFQNREKVTKFEQLPKYFQNQVDLSNCTQFHIQLMINNFNEAVDNLLKRERLSAQFELLPPVLRRAVMRLKTSDEKIEILANHYQIIKDFTPINNDQSILTANIMKMMMEQYQIDFSNAGNLQKQIIKGLIEELLLYSAVSTTDEKFMSLKLDLTIELERFQANFGVNAGLKDDFTLEDLKSVKDKLITLKNSE